MTILVCTIIYLASVAYVFRLWWRKPAGDDWAVTTNGELLQAAFVTFLPIFNTAFALVAVWIEESPKLLTYMNQPFEWKKK